MTGVLQGVRIVEFEGIGPGPFCGMMLADHGAEVVRIARPGGNAGGAPLPTDQFDILARGRRTIVLDLKDDQSVETCLQILESADGLIEGFRPGVMERLGLGPDIVLGRNPALAYGRMTGWGQSGPRSMLAGHDINYIAITGALHSIGTEHKPVPPLNLVGDFGGGSMFLAFGLLAAIIHARATGRGQVVDCAVSDGASVLMGPIWGLCGSGAWRDTRAANILDGGAPFYDTYRCADGQWVAVGAIEPEFYHVLLSNLGLNDERLIGWWDYQRWPQLKQEIAAAFAARPRAHWDKLFAGLDACYTPILSLSEAAQDPHNVARVVFVEIDGVTQPAPAPRFSETPGAIKCRAANVSPADIITEWSVAQ